MYLGPEIVLNFGPRPQSSYTSQARWSETNDQIKATIIKALMYAVIGQQTIICNLALEANACLHLVDIVAPWLMSAAVQ